MSLINASRIAIRYATVMCFVESSISMRVSRTKGNEKDVF